MIDNRQQRMFSSETVLYDIIMVDGLGGMIMHQPWFIKCNKCTTQVLSWLGTGCMWVLPGVSPQLCYEPKTALKYKICFQTTGFKSIQESLITLEKGGVSGIK